jgi:type I restriction enzyme S subunit
MTSQKNVGWVRPEAVTHQDQTTGQNEWPILAIEQVTDVNPRIDKSAIPDDLPVSFVPMPAVGAGNGAIHVDEARPAGEVKKGFTAFLEGDVLFAKITPCMENGKMAVVPRLVNGYGFGSTEFHVLRPKSGMDAKYLYYYVSSQSFRGEAGRYMTGAVGQKRVSTDYLKRSKIPVAPLDQQKRIVAEIEKQFSRLDEAVANLKRVKANLKRYKAAVLKAAVEGRLVETEAELARREGRSYETGAQLLQRILETRRSQWKGKGKYKEPTASDTTDLPELPEGWVWATAEQLGHVQLGRQRSPKNRSKDYPVKYIRAGNITEAGLDLADVLDMEFVPAEQERYRLRRGDLVLSEASGSPDQVGKPAVWQDQLSLCCFQNTVIRLRPTIEMSPYLLTCFQSYYVNGLFARVAGGVGINHLSADKFSRVQVPVSPLAEQYRIITEVDRRLSFVREVEIQVDINLQRSELLRQSILNRAFSGKLIQSNANAESGSWPDLSMAAEPHGIYKSKK